uniref:EF-hand domain-containing protein n=1 Tax=Eutreptiella gymnastica TaxID=73025 RepID=A0A7S1N509_9EUGL|mmetsp:Transcript_119821/g.208675  ORF Transcript_119821/g.208675 Transcript_119821/m.208675 type:complete len:358 (+) Transcript_119821:76-1149(+)
MAFTEDEYEGMSAVAIYEKECKRHGCKCNSALLKQLPKTPEVFDSLEIDLSNNMVGTKGILAVLEVVKLSYKLKKFNLRDNYLDNAAINQIVNALKDHPAITHLDVSNNPISWTAGMCLLDLVDSNGTITRLDIGGTHIRDDIVKMIQQKIEMNQRGKVTRMAKPINSHAGIRLRALKTLYAQIHKKERHPGYKVHKKNIVKGWKENKRLQGMEAECEQPDSFWVELQMCCTPDANDLIQWEAFMLISMCNDVSYAEKDVKHLREEFKKWDKDSNGYIDLLELRDMMTELCGGREPSHDEVLSLMSMFDADMDNTTNWDEFCLMMYEWMQGAPMIGGFVRTSNTTLSGTTGGPKKHL